MREQSSVIVNGVDLDRFSPAHLPEPVVSDGPDRRPISLLAVGSIHANKNFNGLVDALVKLRESKGAVPVVRWAGRDPSEEVDKSALAEAVRKLDAAGLADSWEWLGVRTDIPQLLAAADAFIHPSFYEGLPNAVCEALAAGRPVLASNVCDHPWLVADGERGLLFDPHDPDDIAASIRRFASLTTEERRGMGIRARSFAEENLALDVFTDNYESLFRSLT
jgi:glycosyltransferase involved in cell wall biosynthesis